MAFLDRRFVRMTGNDHTDLALARVEIESFQVMNGKQTHVLNVQRLGVIDGPSPVAVVVVAAHDGQRCDAQ